MGPGGGLLSLRAVFPFFCQVCEAGLHISVGIGMRLFSCLQHDCQQLDLLICLDKDERELSEVEK